MKIIIATFALVFLRAIQQQNVIHRQYVLAGITPFAIATAEVASVLLVVSTGWESIPMVGIGGCGGVLSAMYLHNKYLKK